MATGDDGEPLFNVLDVCGCTYGELLLSNSDMTAAHASSILGTANSAMQHMGGTEASRNFLMQQFGMDPIRAQARAEGGLFANGLDNQDIAGFMSVRGIKGWNSQYKGPSGSNLDVTMQGLDKAYFGRGHVDNSGDNAAAWANGIYGSTVGTAYSYRSDIADGMSQLMGSGMDKSHASAIVASAIRESSMDPAAGSKGSYGLFQFDKNRANDFQKVMHESLYGSSQQGQFSYMMKSMQKGGEEAGPGAEFFASSGKDAARVFSSKIERPKDKSKEGDIRSGIADSLNSSDIHITLNQTVATPGGGQKTKKISTTVPLPTASGLYKDPFITEIPGG